MILKVKIKDWKKVGKNEKRWVKLFKIYENIYDKNIVFDVVSLIDE